MTNLDGDHAVLLTINLSDDMFGTPEEQNRMYDLEEKLTELVEEGEVGTCEGNEFDSGTFTLSFSGPDAEALAKTVLVGLKKEKLPRGGEIVKRFGPLGDPDAREERLSLSPSGAARP